MHLTSEPRHGCVQYDGECRFCTRWARFWTPVLERYGFAVEPVAPLADVRLLARGGEVIAGSEVYLAVMRRIWWTRPFAALFSWPLLRTWFDALYGWIKRNRYCVSRRCP